MNNPKTIFTILAFISAIQFFCLCPVFGQVGGSGSMFAGAGAVITPKIVLIKKMPSQNQYQTEKQLKKSKLSVGKNSSLAKNSNTTKLKNKPKSTKINDDNEYEPIEFQDDEIKGLEPINLAKPEYPKAAQAVAASGQVVVSVTLDEKGSVISAEAISGHLLLRETAVNAALQSTFTPGLYKNKPVRVVGTIIYNFQK